MKIYDFFAANVAWWKHKFHLESNLVENREKYCKNGADSFANMLVGGLSDISVKRHLRERH